MYITFASAKKANKAEPTLALKPRGDVTMQKSKTGVPVAPQKGHMSAKNFLKKEEIFVSSLLEFITGEFGIDNRPLHYYVWKINLVQEASRIRNCMDLMPFYINLELDFSLN